MRVVKVFLPLSFVFLFVFSSCQKVDLENQMSEESKAIATFDNGEIVVKLPVTVKESEVFVEKNEKGIINTKIINGVRVSPSYKLVLPASACENLKNEDDIVIGLRTKDFVDGYDFFYVTFNGNIEFPWIGKAIKNEKEDIVYFKICGMLLKEFLKGQKFDKLVIEFNLVRNPDYQKKSL